MADKKKIKVTPTLAKLYESQGLIADAIAAYETIYAQTPSEELFTKLEELRHRFIQSGHAQEESDQNIVSGIFTAHEKEYFRILTHRQYLKYTAAYDPDESELDIKIELEDDDDKYDIIEVDKDETISGEKIDIPKPADPIFQEVLNNIAKAEAETEQENNQENGNTVKEDILNQNLAVRDIITHLKRVYGEDTPLKSIDAKAMLESIAALLK
ncbi:MAG: hypothetical protein JXR56_01550 [Candidatus Cloacimonetes bacterium]|nr:hypothetical protein [Candidatus Cloacimonadota bacterium]